MRALNSPLISLSIRLVEPLRSNSGYATRRRVEAEMSGPGTRLTRSVSVARALGWPYTAQLEGEATSTGDRL
ncbi:MAG: hypothetical protein DRK00_02040 [Thermoprotei archaeon]|nr:MAG: hypothetical protein DRK00_02040 [Thermoprotei archaeon]